DMIISIGFRVNSKKAIKFRSWANEIIKDYMIQGFALDDDRNSDIAKDFYATVQNKFHYAITRNTAAEIIYKRVDSKKANMGLTNWDKSPDGKILKSDVSIAKNYLNEKEIKNLNNLVNLFLDIAESMNDWKNEVETSLKLFHYEVLEGKGKISAENARQKAENEYEKYKIIQDKKFVSDFDKLLIETEKLENH
ncbi:cell filamentation protein Fic, partial [bacterium]|nr:cell filamentation protein Fic [bacterium]